MQTRAQVALQLGEAILDLVQETGVFNKKRGRKPVKKAKAKKAAKAEKSKKAKKAAQHEDPID